MINIVGYDRIPQMRAFDDVREALSFDRDVYLGAFAAGMLNEPIMGEVIYNMEYLHDKSPLWGFGYEETLRNNLVLDFSLQNVKYLQQIGIDAFHMPYGYSDGLVKHIDVIPYDARPIDVMFIGSMHHDRRRTVIDELRRNCRVSVVESAYGDDLDRMIGHAKVHLNMHHVDGQPLETVRLNYLMANGCNVVSERDNDDTVNSKYADGAHFCDYAGIVDSCMMALSCVKDGSAVVQQIRQDCIHANRWINERTGICRPLQ